MGYTPDACQMFPGTKSPPDILYYCGPPAILNFYNTFGDTVAVIHQDSQIWGGDNAGIGPILFAFKVCLYNNLKKTTSLGCFHQTWMLQKVLTAWMIKFDIQMKVTEAAAPQPKPGSDKSGGGSGDSGGFAPDKKLPWI